MHSGKITRILGICFLLYGVLLASSLWCHLTVTMPLLSGQEATNSAWAALKSVEQGGILLRFLWLGMALAAGIGAFGAKKWVRWLGLFLAGSVPISYLNRGLMFGAATVVTPMSVCVSLAAIIVFLFLWKSRQAKKIFGYDTKAAKNAWAALAVLCFMPAMLFGFVIYVKSRHHAAHIKQAGRVVYQAGQAVGEGFVARDLLGFRLAVPPDARIVSIKKRAKNGSATVALLTPDENILVFISSDAIGELMAGMGRAIGIGAPYDIHRHVLRSEWNIVFLVTKAIAIPRLGKGNDMQLTELEAPRWRGLVVQGSQYDGFRAEYSIYGRDDPHQSVSCLWSVRMRALSVAQVERSMGAFEFLASTNKAQEQYIQEADKALAEGRQLDAQFALAQAYLHGEKNPIVTRKLADISAELGSWQLVRKLTQELLADDPENPEVKALYERALKASEQKDVGGSEKEVSPARLN